MRHCKQAHALNISIHALREEGDSIAARKVMGFVTISIHALREEGDIRYFVQKEIQI